MGEALQAGGKENVEGTEASQLLGEGSNDRSLDTPASSLSEGRQQEESPVVDSKAPKPKNVPIDLVKEKKTRESSTTKKSPTGRKKIPTKKGQAPEKEAIDPDAIAPGFAMLASGVHAVLASRMGPAWALTDSEAGQIGQSMGVITAAIFPYLDPKWVLVGMSLATITGIEYAHYSAYEQQKQQSQVQARRQATQQAPAPIGQPPKNNVTAFIPPTEEPVGKPIPTSGYNVGGAM